MMIWRKLLLISSGLCVWNGMLRMKWREIFPPSYTFTTPRSVCKDKFSQLQFLQSEDSRAVEQGSNCIAYALYPPRATMKGLERSCGASNQPS
jgi:hypothetical protein